MQVDSTRIEIMGLTYLVEPPTTVTQYVLKLASGFFLDFSVSHPQYLAGFLNDTTTKKLRKKEDMQLYVLDIQYAASLQFKTG